MQHRDDPDHPASDNASMAEGGPTELLIKEAVRLLDQLSEEAGWDQPSVLWRVDMPSVVDLAPELVSGSTMGLALGFVPIAEFECHPNEVLSGLTIDGPDFIGAALVNEAWTYPLTADGDNDPEQAKGYTRPSEHPDRVEVRLVVLLLRDGSIACAMRTRGSDATVLMESSGTLIDGTVLRHLRRAVGLPSRPEGPEIRLETIRERLGLVASVLLVQQLLDEFGVPDGTAPGGRSVPREIDEQLASWAEEIEAPVRTFVERCGFDRANWDEVLDYARTHGVPEELGSPELLQWFDAAMWVDWLDSVIATTDQSLRLLEAMRPCSPLFVDRVLRSFTHR